MKVEVILQNFELKRVKCFVSMTAKDKKMTNQYDHKAVIPRSRESAVIESGSCIAEIEPLSFSMIRIDV